MAVSIRLTFPANSPSQTLTAPIDILSDVMIENTEMFTLNLVSTDLSINIVEATATVVITDTSRVQVEFTEDVFTVSEGDESLNVCVALTGGELAGNIQVEISAQSSTAIGMQNSKFFFHLSVLFVLAAIV